jgi:hypothetical protein
MPEAKREIQELIDLLDQEKVKEIAANVLAGLSIDNYQLFLQTDVEKLMVVFKQQVNSDIIKTLINLSSKETYAQIMSNREFIQDIVLLILIPSTRDADLLCILLNNLSKFDFVLDILQENSDKKETGMLDNLLQVFTKDKSFNSRANFDYLGGLFANLSAQKNSDYFLGKSRVDGEERLVKIIDFIGHSRLIRKMGALSVLKNILFNTDVHSKILLNSDCNILPKLMLPLAGPEDLTEEEMDGLPDELMFLEPDKKREENGQIRLILVEILLLLCSTRECRVILREKKVYTIVQKCHLVETNEEVIDAIDRLVQFLMRDEV